MLKKSLIILTFLSLSSFARDRGRAPAVMDGTCNLEKLTTFTVIVNGKSVLQKRPTEEIEKKELCAEVTKCMYSADDELMVELKALKGYACDNVSATVTPKVPSISRDKNFDGRRTNKVSEGPAESATAVKPENTPR